MEVFDLKGMAAYPQKEREKNVLHRSEDFSARFISLPPGGEIPPCEMAVNVILTVVSGSVTVKVNGKVAILEEGYCLIAEPATLSILTSEGAKILAIQVPRREGVA